MRDILDAMANDREVLREIWDGKIPVCFTLNSEEICDLQGPDPFYLMVPRLSYFPLCTEKVRDFCSTFPFNRNSIIRINLDACTQIIIE